MGANAKKQPSGGPIGATAAPKRRLALWLVAGVAAVAVVTGAVVGLRASAARAAQAQRLVGRWPRPDGGYVLDIRAARRDGQLEAAYFNPRDIHVERNIYDVEFVRMK